MVDVVVVIFPFLYDEFCRNLKPGGKCAEVSSVCCGPFSTWAPTPSDLCGVFVVRGMNFRITTGTPLVVTSTFSIFSCK